MYKRKFHIILLLLLIVILCFTVAACSKPAGEGGVNNNNIGKDSTIDSNLNSYISNNSELINTLLDKSGYKNSSVEVVDVSNFETLYSYVDKKYDFSDESLTDIEKEKIQGKNRSMKKNIKSVFERRGIKTLVINTGDSIIPECSIFSSAANFFESYCEYMLAIQDPFYTDDLNSNLTNAQNKYRTICINYNEYILNFDDSNIMDNYISMFKLIDSVESRGDYDYIKNSNIVLNYTGHDKIVFIPEDVEQIQTYAFANRQDIEEIVFNKDVPIINRDAFDHMLNLKISVKDNNDFYLSSDQSYQLYNSNSEVMLFSRKYNDPDGYNLLEGNSNTNNYIYGLQKEYYSRYYRYDIDKEYVVYSADILNERLESMGYKNAKISFANKSNTYFFDEYINNRFKELNYTDEQILNLTKLYNDLFKNYNMTVMVVVQNGKAVDIISDMSAIYIPEGNLPLNEKQAAYALFKSVINPDIDITSQEFINDFDNYNQLINRMNQYYPQSVIYVYNGNQADLINTSEFFGCLSNTDEIDITFYDNDNYSTKGLIKVENSYTDSEYYLYENYSMVFDGAFKELKNLKTIKMYNQNSYFGHDLFGGYKDILIFTEQNKADTYIDFANDWFKNGGKNVAIMYGMNYDLDEFHYDTLDIYNSNGLLEPVYDSTLFDLATANLDNARAKVNELGVNMSIEIDAANHPNNTNTALDKWSIIQWNNLWSGSRKDAMYKYFLSKVYDISLIRLKYASNYNSCNIISSNLDNQSLLHFIHESNYSHENYDDWYNNSISEKKLIINDDYIIINDGNFYNEDLSNYMLVKDVLLQVA